MNSMSKLSVSCNAKSSNGHDLAEESGWTIYFEDFYANKMDDYDCDELNPSASLISDAASSADDQKLAIRPCLGQSSITKKLSFKKRRSTKGSVVVVDDALEDTASSPVNSPKVSYLNELMNVNPKEKKNINVFQGKGSSYGEDDDAMAFIGRDNDCSELKKRGLCLVPLSMIANLNYLG